MHPSLCFFFLFFFLNRVDGHQVESQQLVDDVSGWRKQFRFQWGGNKAFHVASPGWPGLIQHPKCHRLCQDDSLFQVHTLAFKNDFGSLNKNIMQFFNSSTNLIKILEILVKHCGLLANLSISFLPLSLSVELFMLIYMCMFLSFFSNWRSKQPYLNYSYSAAVITTSFPICGIK